MIKKKKIICIGTSNFGLKYGINNKKVSYSIAKKMLLAAKKEKVKFIDTAFSYGNSEKIIGKILNKKKNNFKIFSKLDPIKIEKNFDVQKWFDNSLSKTLKNLRQKSIYGMYIHDENQLLGREGKQIFKLLQNAKKIGLIKNIGISIYNKKNLNKLLKNFKFDMIQVPINIIDQRLISTNTLKKIKLKKIKIFARSIFLKKVLLLDSAQRPKFFNQWNSIFNYYDRFIKDNNLKRIDACVSFVKNIKEIDGIIFGISSLNQLNEIFKSFSKNIEIKFSIKENNKLKFEKLVNPSLWNNK